MISNSMRLAIFIVDKFKNIPNMLFKYGLLGFPFDFNISQKYFCVHRFFAPPPSEEPDLPDIDQYQTETCNNNDILQDGVCKLETSDSELEDFDHEGARHDQQKKEWAWGDALSPPIRSAKLATLDSLRLKYERGSSSGGPVFRSKVKMEGRCSKEADGQALSEMDVGPEDGVKVENGGVLEEEKVTKATPKGGGAFSWHSSSLSSSSKPSRRSSKEKPVVGQGLQRFMRTSSKEGTVKMSWNKKARNSKDRDGEEDKENAVHRGDSETEDAKDKHFNSQSSDVSYGGFSQGQFQGSQDSELKTFSQTSDLYSMDAEALSLSQFGVSRNSQVLDSQGLNEDCYEQDLTDDDSLRLESRVSRNSNVFTSQDESRDIPEEVMDDDCPISQDYVSGPALDQFRVSRHSKSQDLSDKEFTKSHLSGSQFSSNRNQETTDNLEVVPSPKMCQNKHLPKLPSLQDIEGKITQKDESRSNGLFSRTRTLTSFYAPKKSDGSLALSSSPNTQCLTQEQDSTIVIANQERNQSPLSEMCQKDTAEPGSNEDGTLETSQITSFSELPAIDEDIVQDISTTSKSQPSSSDTRNIFSPASTMNHSAKFYPKKTSLTVSSSSRRTRKKDVTDAKSSYFFGTGSRKDITKKDEDDEDDESGVVDEEVDEERARDSDSTSPGNPTDVECIDLTDCEETKLTDGRKVGLIF